MDPRLTMNKKILKTVESTLNKRKDRHEGVKQGINLQLRIRIKFTSK